MKITESVVSTSDRLVESTGKFKHMLMLCYTAECPEDDRIGTLSVYVEMPAKVHKAHPNAAKDIALSKLAERAALMLSTGDPMSSEIHSMSDWEQTEAAREYENFMRSFQFVMRPEFAEETRA